MCVSLHENAEAAMGSPLHSPQPPPCRSWETLVGVGRCACVEQGKELEALVKRIISYMG